ncbi:MAG TPA: hypothetical protein VIC07_02075 [Acidimicrobiia bacterium]
MTEIPESLLRRSAEAKAKALGLPVEQVLAEMKGEVPPTPLPQPDEAPVAAGESPAEQPPAEAPESIEEAVAEVEPEPEPVEEVPPADVTPETPEIEVTAEAEVPPAPPTEAPTADEVEEAQQPAAVATVVEERPEPSGNGAGNGKVASVVSPRPVVPPKGTPEGVRSQRLLTVVKARAIQTVKAEPTDKVNTWPHLMLMEFGALLAITGLLVIMAVIIHSPLLDPANFNATPNPSKAPWYFLGLQELLSYFDPQIAGVMIPTITGMIGFMMVPFVDKNPSTRPSDRKFAIALYSVFLAGAATLTIFGVLFRGLGFNFSYPWKDGVFFDDLKDWVNFE